MSAVLAEFKPGNAGSLSSALNRNGRAQIAPGAVIHRPSRDVEPEPEEAPSGRCTSAERAAVAAAFKPLAECEARQRDLDTQARELRGTLDNSGRAKLDALAEQAEALKREHAQLRGHARLAYLHALEAAAKRAGAGYRTASSMLADAAADLEGLARLRDDLLGRSEFDPMGMWTRSNALLAPPVGLRPPGWGTVHDVWGRECYWSPEAVSHLNAMREVKQAFRSELDPAMTGAAFPF